MLFSVRDYLIEKKATKAKIFSKVSQRELFIKYANLDPKRDRLFKNPFRVDEHAGCTFFTRDDGSLVFYDHSKKKSYDIFEVLKLKGYRFHDALVKIYKDFDLDNRKQKITLKKSKKQRKLFQVEKIPFTKEGLEYWKQFGIGKRLLTKFKVIQISRFYINKKLIFEDKLAFAYLYPEDGVMKIYQPYGKEGEKWFFNGTNKHFCGLEHLPFLGDLLIITKSRKDVMVLSKFGYHAISPPSEIPKLPSDIIETTNMFDNTIIFYDNDGYDFPKGRQSGKGKMLSRKLSELTGFPRIMIPDGEPKDISDYYKKYGKEKTEELLKTLIHGNSRPSNIAPPN